MLAPFSDFLFTIDELQKRREGEIIAFSFFFGIYKNNLLVEN